MATKETTIIDSDHPLFLHPSNTTDLSLISIQLTGTERSKSHHEHENNIKLFQFLMGLNENYTNARSNLLMRVRLPTLNEAYSVLIIEENHRTFSSRTNTESILGYVNTSDSFSFYSSNSNYRFNPVKNENNNNNSIKKTFVC